MSPSFILVNFFKYRGKMFRGKGRERIAVERIEKMEIEGKREKEWNRKERRAKSMNIIVSDLHV